MTTETADLFDLDDIDDILDDSDIPVCNSTSDATAEPVASSKTKSTNRRRAPCPAGTLYCDLETIPDYSRESQFGLDPLPTPAVYMAENDSPAPSKLIEGTEEEVKTAVEKAQANGKMIPRVILEAALSCETKREKPKPRKGVMSLFSGMIAAIDNEAANLKAAAEARCKTMAVCPEMNRIVAFGWGCGSDRCEALVLKPGENHDAFERSALEKFWELSRRHKVVVGYNVLHFDLPTIFMRSALLGVEPSKQFDMKPWGSDVCDLMKKRWPSGPAMKLKEFVTRLGFEVPADGVDGSHVGELVAAGKWQEVRDYVLSDVAITRELHLFGRGLFW